jgi:hypothetical protein
MCVHVEGVVRFQARGVVHRLAQKATCKRQKKRGVVERYILLSSLIARRVKYATSTLEMPVMELSRPKTSAIIVSEEARSAG